MNSKIENQILERLTPFHNEDYAWRSLKHPGLNRFRKAAILIPLFIKGGEAYVWLTKRANHLRNDGGDVAFPGGMKDATDRDEIHTCLRESEEEIGLKGEHIDKTVAQLLPRVNRRRLLITPVIALVNPNFTPVINEAEVETAFALPLKRFLSNENHTSNLYSSRDVTWVIHFFKDMFEGKEITTWGLTAAMCVEIAVCVYRSNPSFVWSSEGDGNTVENPFHLQQVYLERFAKGVASETTSKL